MCWTCTSGEGWTELFFSSALVMGSAAAAATVAAARCPGTGGAAGRCSGKLCWPPGVPGSSGSAALSDVFLMAGCPAGCACTPCSKGWCDSQCTPPCTATTSATTCWCVQPGACQPPKHTKGRKPVPSGCDRRLLVRMGRTSSYRRVPAGARRWARRPGAGASHCGWQGKKWFGTPSGFGAALKAGLSVPRGASSPARSAKPSPACCAKGSGVIAGRRMTQKNSPCGPSEFQALRPGIGRRGGPLGGSDNAFLGFKGIICREQCSKPD